MNRIEFMSALKQLLVSIPEEERAEAVQYYEDYFEDAGPENEEQVIKELGSPEKVAAIIWADMKSGSEENGEFTENGYTDVRFEEKAHPACREEQGEEKKEESAKAEEPHTAGGNTYTYRAAGEQETGYGQNHGEYGQNRDYGQNHDYRQSSGGHASNGGYHSGSQPQQVRTNKTLKTILIIVLVLVVLKGVGKLIPAVFSIIGGIVGIIIGLLGLLIGIAAAGVGMVVAGVVIVVTGVGSLLVSFASAILVMGVGLLLIGLGMLLAVAAVKLSLVVYPALFRAVVAFVRGLFHGKEAA